MPDEAKGTGPDALNARTQEGAPTGPKKLGQTQQKEDEKAGEKAAEATRLVEETSKSELDAPRGTPLRSALADPNTPVIPTEGDTRGRASEGGTATGTGSGPVAASDAPELLGDEPTKVGAAAPRLVGEQTAGEQPLTPKEARKQGIIKDKIHTKDSVEAARQETSTSSRQFLTEAKLRQMKKQEILAVGHDRGYKNLGFGTNAIIRNFLQQQNEDFSGQHSQTANPPQTPSNTEIAGSPKANELQDDRATLQQTRPGLVAKAQAKRSEAK